MSSPGREIVPTRAMLLELDEERKFVREGHEFLDQKRMLLVAEILSWLRRLQPLEGELQAAQQAATGALADAVCRHGIEELSAYPVQSLAGSVLAVREDSFLGIALREASWLVEPSVAPSAANPSPEARRAGLAFRDLLRSSAELAAVSGTVRRLLREYKRAERRARALENVILPELERAVREVTEQLEEQEQEEAIVVRRRRGRGRGEL